VRMKLDREPTNAKRSQERLLVARGVTLGALLALALVGCSTSAAPPLLTDASLASTVPATSASLTAEASVAAATTPNTTANPIGTAPPPAVSKSEPKVFDEGTEAKIRADAAAYNRAFTDEYFKLPNINKDLLVNLTAPGSDIRTAITKDIAEMIASGTTLRRNANNVEVFVVGTIRFIATDRASVEICQANNTVVLDRSGTVTNEALGTVFTTEEWVLSNGVWKPETLRSKEEQEGNQCDRIK
jgi:hypothetical protein